ncbi:MAG: hypothetical protein WDW36_000534 [Sanguina aurantia]
MQGTLFKYASRPSAVAFKTGNHTRHVALVGGLTDGFMFAPVAAPLATALDAAAWSLVQVQLSSSYQGFGISSLDRDAAEMRELVACLGRDHSSSHLVLIGHSTGCQDVARFLQRGFHLDPAASDDSPAKGRHTGDAAAGEQKKSGGTEGGGGTAAAVAVQGALAAAGTMEEAVGVLRAGGDESCAGAGSKRKASWPTVVGSILQAPVSEREWLTGYLPPNDIAALVQAAVAMVDDGRGEEIVCRMPAHILEDRTPMCAARLVALACKGGDDDMFSSDLTDEELKAILAPVGAAAPCLVLVSGADETMAASVDKRAVAERLATAVGANASFVVTPDAPHNLEGLESQAVKVMVEFVVSVSPPLS